MIDLHTHVLAGIDDGPATIAESLEMLADCVKSGVQAVAATPHVRDDYPTTAALMEHGVGTLRREAEAQSIRVEILTGGEISLERLSTTPTAELRRFGLGGSSSYLLVEFPYHGWPPNLAEQLAALRSNDFRAVLAHPERNDQVQAAPARLEPLVENGALIQLTAASVAGMLGRRTHATALRLLELGLAHLLASDIHARGTRAGLAAAVRKVPDELLAHWLTTDVPQAIVSDNTIPPRPSGRRRRLWKTQ